MPICMSADFTVLLAPFICAVMRCMADAAMAMADESTPSAACAMPVLVPIEDMARPAASRPAPICCERCGMSPSAKPNRPRPAAPATAPAPSSSSPAPASMPPAPMSMRPAPSSSDSGAMISMLDATMPMVADMSASPAPASRPPTPITSRPAPATSAPAPSTIRPTPSAMAPTMPTRPDTPSSITPPASAAMAPAACRPYSAMVGSCGPIIESPAPAASAPTPTSAMAAPNASMPTAPAVSAGPSTAARPIRPATAATMPNIVAMAAGPADATPVAASAMSHNPAAASATPAPMATTATAAASICLAEPDAAAPAAFSPAAVVNRPAPAAAALPAMELTADEMPLMAPTTDLPTLRPTIAAPRPMTAGTATSACSESTLMAGITVVVSTSEKASIIGANASASPRLMFCQARSIFSVAVRVFSYTSSSAPPLPSAMALYMSSKFMAPFLAASYMVTPALAPNISMAAAESMEPSSTPLTNSAKPSLADLPSLAQFATPRFMPASTPCASMPAFSKLASIAMDSSVLNPSCLKLAALAVTDCARRPTSMPAACPATVSLSSTLP